MRYELKYPAVAAKREFDCPKDVYVEPRIFKGGGHYPCWVCGELTNWRMDFDRMELQMCSDECSEKFLEENDGKRYLEKLELESAAPLVGVLEAPEPSLPPVVQEGSSDH